MTVRFERVGEDHELSLTRILFAIVFALVIGSLDGAEPKDATGGQSVIDSVSLKSGRNLRGSIVWQAPNGVLTMVVSRDWLAGSNPQLLASSLKDNLEGRKAGWTQTRDRIAEHLNSLPEAPHLVFFLKQEVERIEKLLADRDVPDPDFLWFDIRPETISKVTRATSDHRRIAIFAWNERLAHVETRDASSLIKELNLRKVKLDDPLPDLTERLPARSQHDDEWAARMAVVEYSLIKPLDFQGMGDTLAPVREGQPANVAEVIPKLIEQQLGSLLKDLSGNSSVDPKAKSDTKFLDPAIRLAERENQKGFRVTRLELDTSATRVTVEARFVARVAEGKWKTVWQFRETSDGTKNRPQAEARIEQDPQVKSALNAVKSLGFVDGAQMQQAIRMGAASMAAQQIVDASFSEFRDRYSRRLDGPPLFTTVSP